MVGLLPFVVLKTFAFVDRHEPKDTYDPIWVLLHHPDGPDGAGRLMAESAVASDPLVEEAMQALRARFASANHDGPAAYAAFQGTTGDTPQRARLRQEAFEVVRLALDRFDAERKTAL